MTASQSEQLVALVIELRNQGWKVSRGPGGEVFGQRGDWHTRATASGRNQLFVQLYAEEGDSDDRTCEEFGMLTFCRLGDDLLALWRECVTAQQALLVRWTLPALSEPRPADESIPF